MKNFNFIEQGSLYAHDLVEVWKKIPSENIVSLSIILANNEVYEPHTQFDVFYNGRKLKYMDIRIAEHRFLSIFFDNLWLLNQIDQYKLLIQELNVSDNWNTTTTTKNVVDNTINLNSDNTVVNTNLGSNTDNNSAVDSTLLTGYMDIENTVTIPANIMSQVKNKENALNTTNTTNNSTAKNESVTSNISSNYINFLKLKIQELRITFYSRFGSLFTL